MQKIRTPCQRCTECDCKTGNSRVDLPPLEMQPAGSRSDSNDYSQGCQSRRELIRFLQEKGAEMPKAREGSGEARLSGENGCQQTPRGIGPMREEEGPYKRQRLSQTAEVQIFERGTGPVIAEFSSKVKLEDVMDYSMGWGDYYKWNGATFRNTIDGLECMKKHQRGPMVQPHSVIAMFGGYIDDEKLLVATNIVDAAQAAHGEGLEGAPSDSWLEQYDRMFVICFRVRGSSLELEMQKEGQGVPQLMYALKRVDDDLSRLSKKKRYELDFMCCNLFISRDNKITYLFWQRPEFVGPWLSDSVEEVMSLRTSFRKPSDQLPTGHQYTLGLAQLASKIFASFHPAPLPKLSQHFEAATAMGADRGRIRKYAADLATRCIECPDWQVIMALSDGGYSSWEGILCELRRYILYGPHKTAQPIFQNNQR